MKIGDWIFALLMLAMGLCCLTVSATSFLERPTESYVQTMLTLCLWLGIPIVLIGAIYFIVTRRRNR